nr:MAG TPA: hypothetical protein [Caudoviricetes sp.]
MNSKKNKRSVHSPAKKLWTPSQTTSPKDGKSILSFLRSEIKEENL